MGGYLTSDSKGNVAGVVHVINSNCYKILQDVPVSGTVTTDGDLKLTSASVSGQVIKFAGKVSSGAIASGTYSNTGGCASGDSGTITGYTVSSYSKAYTGTFYSVSKVQIGFSSTLTQSGPDVDGIYHATGAVKFTGSPCFTTGTITDSLISGNYMMITITTNNGSELIFGGYSTDSTTNKIVGDYEVTGGTCSGDYGTGSVVSGTYTTI